MDDTTDVAQRCMHPPHGAHPCTGSWTFTAADQLGFVDATMQHLEQALGSMTALGKTAIISTEVSRDSAPLNASVFDAMLRRHGAMQVNHLQTWTPPKVACYPGLLTFWCGEPFRQPRQMGLWAGCLERSSDSE